MPIEASQIARWLRFARERAELSQGGAALVAGLSPDAISKWERGEKGIMAENFVALVIAYKADVRAIPAELNALDAYQSEVESKARRVAELGAPVGEATKKTRRAASTKKKSPRRPASGE